jgi:hypothetical protein
MVASGDDAATTVKPMDLTNLLLVISGAAALILGIWALVDLWRGPNTVGSKIGWTIGILLLPVIISILYLVSRPSSRMQQKAYEVTESPEDIVRKYGHDGDL